MPKITTRLAVSDVGHTTKMLMLLLLVFPGKFALGQPLAVEISGDQEKLNETFALPDTLENFEQLAAFVEKISEFEPSGNNKSATLAHQRKIARSVVAGVNKLSSQKLNDQDAMQSTNYRLTGLRILSELNEPKAEQSLSQAIEAALADKRPGVQAVGAKFMVQTGFAQWPAWDEAERTKFIGKIVNYFSLRPPEVGQVNMIGEIADMLGSNGGKKHAVRLISQLVPHYQKSKDPEIRQALTFLQGIERRINLPGNSIKLNGTLLDGTKLDWPSYRGKVVLVDYWATWCGPCRAEVPNMLKMYQAYHDKGFEVLGISLDQRSEQAESYIKQTEIPWPTMFSNDPDQRGWKHPMAVRYGVAGIPLAILVDRDGKVVHMLARGENLERELRRLLGEPVARSKQKTRPLVRQLSNATPEQ